MRRDLHPGDSKLPEILLLCLHESGRAPVPEGGMITGKLCAPNKHGEIPAEDYALRIIFINQ
jgi:hypothetical protein